MRIPFASPPHAVAVAAFPGTPAIAAPEPEVPMADLLATAAEAGNFATLLAAVKLAGLAPCLSTDGPFTLFAPTDQAFAAIPQAKRDRLLCPACRDELAALIGAHVTPGRIGAEAFEGAALVLPTLAGVQLRLRCKAGLARVEGAGLLAADIEATNGVIHVIDRVLAPRSRGARRPAAPGSGGQRAPKP